LREKCGEVSDESGSSAGRPKGIKSRFTVIMIKCLAHLSKGILSGYLMVGHKKFLGRVEINPFRSFTGAVQKEINGILSTNNIWSSIFLSLWGQNIGSR
jgi:hypothetical protein